MNFGVLDRHLLERSSRKVLVGQGHQAEHLRRIFERPIKSQLTVAELAFNNSGQVLDRGTYDAIFLVKPLFDADKTRPGLCLSLTA